MKSFKEVEATRRSYHADGALNSVHRSSLTVPEVEGAIVEISFLNHFLIKRNYPKVACQITAIDPEGHRIEARLFEITEPRVYTIPLTGMVDAAVGTYLVEFFAAENLFIPFPAVVINHRSKGFLNSVHSYNRVLNDVFEDDTVNRQAVCEASIDVRIDDQTETFVLFTAGPQRCQGELDFMLGTEDASYDVTVPIDAPRFSNHEFGLREIYPDLPATVTGTLRVKQPHQQMFFGRMLAGQRWSDGAFCANHSYYDTSASGEYWDDDRSSYRTYPYFQGLDNIVRMHPIMSPGRLQLNVVLVDSNGNRLADLPAGEANDGARPGH